VRWINLDRMDPLMLQRVAVKYHLHPLAVEDALTVGTRVKFDHYENHLYLCIPAFPLEEINYSLHSAASASGRIGFQTKLSSKIRGFVHRLSGRMPEYEEIDDEKTPLFRSNVSRKSYEILPTEDPGLSFDPDVNSCQSCTPDVEEAAVINHGSLLRYLHSSRNNQTNGEFGGRSANQVEQISIFLVNSSHIKRDRYDTVITTQQLQNDRLWKKAVERMQMPHSKLRQNDGGFLLYILFDNIVDDMMVRVETFAQLLLEWEDIVHGKSSPQQIGSVQQGCHALKAVIRNLQRKLRPLREVVKRLIQDSDNNILLGVDSKIYFRDVSDHLVQVIFPACTCIRMLALHGLNVYRLEEFVSSFFLRANTGIGRSF
jgi:Mg2+ and Co2+ transporter CorA